MGFWAGAWVAALVMYAIFRLVYEVPLTLQELGWRG